MKNQEFNLLSEKWIKVMTKDCRVHEVTITDALLHAHEYVRLSGELPTQDVAIMRLLLAILHTVFSRVDENGNESSLYEIDDVDASLERWAALWNMKKFPEKPIVDYLEEWYDRFWLFHPEKPFWQVPDAVVGTEYTAAKLNGEVLESGNKIRLFAGISGTEKQYLDYAEAARWLVYINAFDDTSGKKKGKNLPSPGVGWLGKIGTIYAKGNNLFETLMLNLTMLKDGTELWSQENKPIWEEDEIRNGERIEIVVPENQAELLTLQSRRVLMARENGKVIGFNLLGGDFFDKVGAFTEQMTVWSKMKVKVGQPPQYQPKIHDPSRQLWHDFGGIFVNEGDCHQPGIVMWYETISEYLNWPKDNIIEFNIVSVQYVDKGFSVNDSFSDSISFSSGIISRVGKNWQMKITEQVAKCDRSAYEIEKLCNAISKAAGNDGNKNNFKAVFYNEIDEPFRKWIRSIEPSKSGTEAAEKVNEWNIRLRNIALNMGADIVRSSGEAAFKGRKVTEKINGKEVVRYYCSPDAYDRFELNIKRLTEKEE